MSFLNQLRVDCNAYAPSKNIFILLMLDPPIQLLFQFRLALYFWKKEGFIYRLIARFFRTHILKTFGCDISMKAFIAPGVVFPHPVGIVIGEGSIIHTGCRIFQHVTIGRRDYRTPSAPIPKSNVVIYAGGVLAGNCIVGEGAIVGANCVVINDVPAGAKLRAVGSVVTLPLTE